MSNHYLTVWKRFAMFSNSSYTRYGHMILSDWRQKVNERSYVTFEHHTSHYIFSFPHFWYTCAISLAQMMSWRVQCWSVLTGQLLGSVRVSGQIWRRNAAAQLWLQEEGHLCTFIPRNVRSSTFPNCVRKYDNIHDRIQGRIQHLCFSTFFSYCLYEIWKKQ